MEPSKINTALLSLVNDETEVRPYGHGHLVTLPLAFYDNDLVTLFVEPAEGGVRVTDQGTTAMRLQMADVDLESSRVSDAWHRSVASLGEHALSVDPCVIGAWGSVHETGRLLFMVAEAALRVDQLRWQAPERRTVPFRDRVVQKIMSIATGPDRVTPNAHLPQTSGRTRQVTAAVGPDPENRVYVQALSGSNRDYAAEHCYYVFSHTNVPRDRVLAVAAGKPESWSEAILKELSSVTDVAFFDYGNDVTSKLRPRLARLESARSGEPRS